MQEFKVQITDDQLSDIRKEMKEEIISDILNGDIKILRRLSQHVSLANFIDYYDLQGRVQELSTKKVGFLTGEEKFLLMTYWMSKMSER